MKAQARRAILEKMRIAEYSDNPEEPMIACNPTDRRVLMDYFNGVCEQGHNKRGKRGWVFCISMPCGNEMEFTSLSDIPLGDLPCPCGREDHFFVKYSLEPLGLNKLRSVA